MNDHDKARLEFRSHISGVIPFFVGDLRGLKEDDIRMIANLVMVWHGDYK